MIQNDLCKLNWNSIDLCLQNQAYSREYASRSVLPTKQNNLQMFTAKIRKRLENAEDDTGKYTDHL